MTYAYRTPQIVRPGPARWHALLVYPQREDAAKFWLDGHGVYSFYPSVLAFKRRPKALVQRVEYFRKYLPGYLFARFPGEPVWHTLFASPFVRDAIRTHDGYPGRLHPRTLKSLRAMAHVDQGIEEKRRMRRLIRKGDRARILDGVSEGQEIEVVEVEAGRAKFRIQMFGAEHDTDIEVRRLEKVG